MRTFILQKAPLIPGSTDKHYPPRAVSMSIDVTAALQPGMKLYEVGPQENAPQFEIEHTCVCLDASRDAGAIRFWIPSEDLKEAE